MAVGSPPVVLEELRPEHWPEVARIYAEGISTGNATFETEVPSWEQWAEFEKALDYAGPLRTWQDSLYERTTSSSRFLMLDAPLSPMKIGRQPSREDRLDWSED